MKISAFKKAFEKIGKKGYSIEDIWGEYSALWRSSAASDTSRLRYEDYANIVYLSNPVGHSCINLKASSVSELDYIIRYEKDGELQEIKDHPVLELLENPSKDRFAYDASESIYYQSARTFETGGEIIINSVFGTNPQPSELWVFEPNLVEPLEGSRIGEYRGFEVEINGKKKTIPTDQIIYHKFTNPLNPWRGLSPQRPAIRHAGVFNKAMVWMNSLLDQAARPSLALLAPMGVDTDTANSIRKELRENYVGAHNAGRPMFLEGGIELKEVGYAPNQMMHTEIINQTGMFIAMVNNTPPELIGEMARKTYNNVFEARLVYHLLGVFPLASRICKCFTHWLFPLYPDLRKLKAYLAFDKDSNEAMEELRDRRARRLERLRMAGCLVANEVRREMGWPELSDSAANKLYIARQVVELSDTLTSEDITEALGGSSTQGTQKDYYQIEDGNGNTIDIPAPVMKLAIAIRSTRDSKSFRIPELVDYFNENEREVQNVP